MLREANLLLPQGRHNLGPGVYVGLVDHIPFGAAMNKGPTFRMGQTHTQRSSNLFWPWSRTAKSIPPL